jgi:hypothetical protein
MFIEIGALAANTRQQFGRPFFYDLFSFQSSTLLRPTVWQVHQPAEFSMTEESRSIHSRALPNYEKAEILRSKIEGYTLNPANAEGKHKARVFKSALGFDQSNWELLRQRILDELPYHEAKLEQTSQWGDSYVVDLPVEGPNGHTAEVHTAWLFRPGADFPSLITAYVLPERK